jgi:transcriptional regulator GlxA family with amidase domain
MRTSSRTVAVVLFDEVELLDVAGPLQVLTMAGRAWNYRPFKVLTVATRTGAVETRNQVRIEALTALSDCPEPELVIVPGGYGARRALADEPLVAWLAHAGEAASNVIATGNGVLLLGKAGLIHGADVSVPRDAAPILAEMCPTARIDADARWRESGKVLTAATAAGAMDAALLLVGRMVGRKQAAAVAAALGIAWSDPSAGSDVEILDPPG